MIIYGKDWPDDEPLATIHLWHFRNWKANKGMLPKHKHFELAIKALWPEKMPNGKKGYIWSEWSYTRLRAFVYNEYQTWWGPSSSGKSTDAGLFALTYWLAAPDQTTITVCSTTKDMLERRIWREIVRFHSLLGKQIPGKRYQQPPRIELDGVVSGDGDNTINAIFAVAVQRGTTAEAVGNMVGMHNDYNVLIIDEMQATRQAAVEAYDNLSTGIESKFLGMGNPVSRLDPLGKASEPIVGWGGISPSNESWPTKRGMCYYFDGLKSPAIKEPKKFYFLLNQKQIDMMAKDPGRDSPRFWSQRRGFVPPEGLSDTVFTENFITKFHIKDHAQWSYAKKIYFALDPAFSAGGDKAVLTPFYYGEFTNGMMGIEFQAPIRINLELSSGEPMSYIMANKIMAQLESAGVTPAELAIDTTGAQSMIADIIDKEWAEKHQNETKPKKCFRVMFGSAPSKEAIGPDDATPCCERYKNKVTELWYVCREFARYDQIRGLEIEAISQFCSREVIQEGRMIRVESKHDMKARTGGKSPDEADSAVVAVDYVRFMLGGAPGKGFLKKTVSISAADVERDNIESATLYNDETLDWPDIYDVAA